MARLPRLSLPGYPHHVIQRGNNQQPIFSGTQDFEFFLALLQENARKFDVAVHAYVLMRNHFHLLLTPPTADALPRFMQSVGRRYVRYFNDTQQRSGTLWEGRYRSSPMQADPYLLACMVYLDLNPVRAGLVAEAADYPWSSHGHYTGLRVDKLVTPHPLFWSLANTPFARETAYARLVRAGVSPDLQVVLTESALTGWALGSEDFVADLQRSTPRRVSKERPGRPARPKPAVD
ncbi:transposase [Polaromonas sp. YR568]|uniref:transposase n=1 Tax=Polaromonas sp. YR568 TaxID=1855301 RepID=UPI0031383B35